MLLPPAELVGRAKATITECSVSDVKDCLGAGTLIIDIREPAELQRGHLPDPNVSERSTVAATQIAAGPPPQSSPASRSQDVRSVRGQRKLIPDRRRRSRSSGFAPPARARER